jgi:hypothetical protein
VESAGGFAVEDTRRSTEMKRLPVVTALVALVIAGLVLAPTPLEAQKKGKKGQSARIQHGIVVKSERIDLSENKAPKGALSKMDILCSN